MPIPNQSPQWIMDLQFEAHKIIRECLPPTIRLDGNLTSSQAFRRAPIYAPADRTDMANLHGNLRPQSLPIAAQYLAEAGRPLISKPDKGRV